MLGFFRSISFIHLLLCHCVSMRPSRETKSKNIITRCFALRSCAVLYRLYVVIIIFFVDRGAWATVWDAAHVHRHTLARSFMTYNRKTNIKRRIMLTFKLVERREWCFWFSIVRSVREVSSSRKIFSGTVKYCTKTDFVFGWMGM